MKQKIIRLMKHKKIQNFSFLTFAQLANYLMPLLVFPYLIRIIGMEKFGLIMFVLAVMQYLRIITEYGFALIAAKDIAQNKNNINELSDIVSNVLGIKIILLLISSFVLLFIISMLGNNIQSPILYYFAIGMIIGEVIFPGWFFHGIEDMHITAILQFVSKLIFILLIIFLVNVESDYENVILYQAIGQLVSGVVALYILRFKYSIHFKMPQKEKIIYYLKDGWHIFVSSFFVKIYNASNTIILGWITNDIIVAYYAIAEKIIFTISLLVGGPLNQVIYPHLANLSARNNEFKRNVFKYTKIMLLVSSFAGLFIFIFSEEIVFLVAGQDSQETILLLQIMAFSIPFFPFGTFLTQILIILRKNSLIMNITFFTTVANFLILIPLVILFKEIGVAITVVIVRIVHILLHIYYNKFFFISKTILGDRNE